MRGQLLGRGRCVSERRMRGVMFAEDRLTMYNETTPSFPHGFCFLSGRRLIPDRFPRWYVLVSAPLQKLLYLFGTDTSATSSRNRTGICGG